MTIVCRTGSPTFLADLMTPLRWSGWTDGATLDRIGRSTAAWRVARWSCSCRHQGRRPSITTVGVALFALAVGSPVVHPWYLAWSVPLLAVAGGPTTARRLAVASALSAVMSAPSVDPVV